MIRKIIFSLGYITLGIGIQAQSLSPNVLSSDGGTAVGEYLILEWTLGEAAVQSITSTDMLLTEGFHQPMLKVEAVESPSATEETDAKAAFTVSIQPNPVATVLHLRLSGDTEEALKVELLDAAGRTLRSAGLLLAEKQLQIAVEDLTPGIYFLQLRRLDGSYVKTFKVSKL